MFNFSHNLVLFLLVLATDNNFEVYSNFILDSDLLISRNYF